MDDNRREALQALKEKMKGHAAESADVVQEGDDKAADFADCEKGRRPLFSLIRSKKEKA